MKSMTLMMLKRMFQELKDNLKKLMILLVFGKLELKILSKMNAFLIQTKKEKKFF